MYSTINITTLDGLQDKIVTDQRPKQIGLHTIELVTDQFYRLVNDNDYRQQPVQSINWNKYQIQIIALEDYAIDLIKSAKTVTVLGLEYHNAIILDVQREQAGDDFSMVTIEYYDNRVDNYKYALPPVENFLRSDSVAEMYDFAQRNVITVQQGAGEIIEFSTMLSFTSTSNAPEANTFSNSQTGQTITTNSVIKKNYQSIFYLNGDDVQAFQNILPLADGYSTTASFYVGGVYKSIQEAPTVTVEALPGFNIWKGSCTFIHSIINNYSYGV